MNVYQSKVLKGVFSFTLGKDYIRTSKAFVRCDEQTEQLILSEWEKVKDKYKPARKSLITLQTSECRFTFPPYGAHNDNDFINVTFQPEQ